MVALTGGANCSVKVGAVPANAFLVRMTQQIVTNFNATTTDTIGLGTTTAGVNIMAAASVHSGAGAISSPTFAAGASGTLLTTGIAQTGANGGYDLYVNYAYTTTNVATAGEVVLVLEYFAAERWRLRCHPDGFDAGSLLGSSRPCASDVTRGLFLKGSADDHSSTGGQNSVPELPTWNLRRESRQCVWHAGRRGRYYRGLYAGYAEQRRLGRQPRAAKLDRQR